FFFPADDGVRYGHVTGVQTCALPISSRRARAAKAVEERFAAARFPFRHDRIVPRITVHAAVGEVSLDPGFRNQKEWTEEAKRTLIRRGYELADHELARHEEAAA